MKKFTLLALACLFTSITVNAQLILHESFEYFNSSNYTLSTHAANSNTMAAAGNYSMKLSGGEVSHTAGFEMDLPNNSQPEYFSCWINSGGTSTTKSKSYVVIGDGTSMGAAMFFYFSSTSSVFQISAGTIYPITAPENEWFKLEMQNINYSTHTYDFFINGELQYKGVPFRNMLLNSITSIRFYNYSSATAAESYTYFDEVTVGEYGTNVSCRPLTTAYSVEDTICEGDDITFISQSPASNGNDYIWSENSAPNSSQIIYSSEMPSFSHTPTASGNMTMYAARSCLNDNILTTIFNGTSSWNGFMFNVFAKNPIFVDSLAFNISNATANTDYDFTLYIKDTSYVGYEDDINAWTVLSTQTINSGDLSSPMMYDLTSSSILLFSGIAKGFCLIGTNGGRVSYTPLVSDDIHQYNDANLMIYGGAGTDFSTTFSPRMPNISIYYRGISDADLVETVGFGTTTSTYSTSTNVRGMAFASPIDFVITGLQAPDDMSGTGNQTVKVIKFKKGLPSSIGTADSTDFIVLGYWKDNASSSFIDCNIPIAAGDIIGVFSGRDYGHYAYSSSSTTPFSINGESTPIYRLGTNSSSLVSNEEYYGLWTTSTGDFARTILRYEIPSAQGFSGTVAMDYVVEDCTGIEEMDNIFAVNLYPNPSNGNFSLDIEMSESSNIQIQVFDAMGRYITSIDKNLSLGTNILNLDLSYLNAGIYHINIINNEQAAQMSFMITK